MSEYEESQQAELQPGRGITKKLFRQWQDARRGSSMAEDMTNPVWLWLFRGRVDPYIANERFKSRWAKLLRRFDFPWEPRWAGCRMGRSRTLLSDGRIFWIAGEHEDHYDPDFYIYNDVIVEDSSGNVRIYGYPKTDFRPTDFHTATTINDEKTILLIGSLGYPDDRELGRTQIYALDTDTLSISAVDASGEGPGWLGSHTATLVDDGSAAIVSGGEVVTDEGLIENIDDWSLSLNDFHWKRLTDRSWPRFQVRRIDKQGLHLFQYEMLSYALRRPRLETEREELAQAIDGKPNMEAFSSLYTPPVPHLAEQPKDNEVSLRTQAVIVEKVRVRYTDDMSHITVTIEGELPMSINETIADDLRQKLTLVENAECEIRWIG